MRRIWIFSGIAAALFVGLGLIEAMDADHPLTVGGLALDMIEKGLLASAVVATAYVALEGRDMRRDRNLLLNDLARARADGDRWREAAKVHLDGLGRAIQDQFDKWALTQGEADIAVLMLKGLSHKEIARLRVTSEATVRQQATSIYRKCGLASRAELAAFFLEDLLAPRNEVPVRGQQKMALVDRS